MTFLALLLVPLRLMLAGLTVGVALAGRRAGHVLRRSRAGLDAGMSTAEYAVGTVAAVAFAVVLFKVVRSPAVSSGLTDIINSALHSI